MAGKWRRKCDQSLADYGKSRLDCCEIDELQSGNALEMLLVEGGESGSATAGSRADEQIGKANLRIRHLELVKNLHSLVDAKIIQ